VLVTGKTVDCLSGVGEARKALLKKLSVLTVGDLLLHIPVRFIDRRFFSLISDIHPGLDATVRGEIVSVTRKPGKRGPSVSAVLSDETGAVTLTFFRSGFPASKLKKGMTVVACGTVESFRGYTIVHPDLYFSRDASQALDAPGMLPVYRLTAGLTQTAVRKLVLSALDAVKDSLEVILPADVLKAAGFSSRWEVFRAAHVPDSPGEADAARNLLVMEELFLYRSILAAVRKNSSLQPGVRLSPVDIEDFQKTLPWALTQAQKKVCLHVSDDLQGTAPMRRLIQGDVGSGKTVVAAYACITTALAGKTAVVLAPTEVLAAQHYRSIGEFCHRYNLNTFLLTGGTTGSQRNAIAREITEKPQCVLVGTHAVLEDWVPLDNLALLVVDEQHRFGVAQRERLLAGRTPRPHSLVMSATPIPRTLAMTFYGDLDVSVLDEMPPGRGSTETRVVDSSDKSDVFQFMLERLRLGERIFLVYPLKEVSEKTDLLDAASAYETVCRGPMAKFGVGLLHGSMSPAEKLSVTERFSKGEISVLVSTTVIEVGIDVPDATVMVIVNAERFGLSQLHQLRGRVGRGSGNAWCFLVPGKNASRISLERLHLLESTSDGFVIAEKDLSFRGPGQVLGTAQHGIPKFKVADLLEDGPVLRKVSNMSPMELHDVRRLMKSQAWRYGDTQLPRI